MPGNARSLKFPDSTVLVRRLVAGVNAANGTPTANATGDDMMAGMGTYEAADIIASCTGAGGSYEIRIWWWYEVAELWVLDAVIGTVAVSTAGGPVAFPLLNNPAYVCAKGFYVEVLTFAGGGVASVWAAGRPLAVG